MNSAAEVSTAESPEAIMSRSEYWAATSGSKMPYNSVGYKVNKFFGGTKENQFDSEYEAYLNNVNNRNEAKAVQSARAWDEYMSSTAYSRAFKDLEAAGVNPYLLLNSGSSPSTSVGSSSKGSYSRSSTAETKSNIKGRDAALIMLAIARLIAAL